MENSPKERSRTAWNTVRVATLLVVIKGVTYTLTGSAGILGALVDSILDAFASLLVLWGVLTAERPADADHPWGHGKAESLASLAQGILILISGSALAYESLQRLWAPQESLQLPGLGIASMFVSSAITLWWVRYLRQAAVRTGSPALEADSLHYASDLWMNASVVGGLLLSGLLGQKIWPDILVGVGIALMILNAGREILFKAVANLMDRGLEPAEATAILQVIQDYAPQVAGFHDLRTRRSGRDVFLEIHLDLDRHLSFIEAHELSEEVGLAIETAIPRSRVTVHADPL